MKTPAASLAVLAMAAILASCGGAAEPAASTAPRGGSAAPTAGSENGGDAGSPGDGIGGADVVQPGAPGQSTRVLTAAETATLEQPRYTRADVAFMRGMIPHHAQALEMAALVPGRTDNRDIHLLARRIDISQRDEIALMERWLRDRGEPVAMEHAGHGGHALMPGMLTAEQMEGLAAASGSEFDRLFLELMIQHHEGALSMVADLFSSVGGGQETDIFQFASHVDADQHIEILRMRRMLESSP